MYFTYFCFSYVDKKKESKVLFDSKFSMCTNLSKNDPDYSQ